MASNKLLQDTATLFVPLGENDDGIMQYGAYLLEKVFCRISAGTNHEQGEPLRRRYADAFHLRWEICHDADGLQRPLQRLVSAFST